ncbi:MAG: hypothetical protein FWH20_03860 [Oscillospiraceae bacterium]|nr:hypothetical protein [Oscillospiraceae bacterium]
MTIENGQLTIGGAVGGGGGLCLRHCKGIASPPHKPIRLYFLDMKLISSRLNKFHLHKKSTLAFRHVLRDNGSAREG